MPSDLAAARGRKPCDRCHGDAAEQTNDLSGQAVTPDATLATEYTPAATPRRASVSARGASRTVCPFASAALGGLSRQPRVEARSGTGGDDGFEKFDWHRRPRRQGVEVDTSGGQKPHCLTDDGRVLTRPEVTRFGVALFGKRIHPAAIGVIAVDTHGMASVDECLQRHAPPAFEFLEAVEVEPAR
jgi:hypothetical protein